MHADWLRRVDRCRASPRRASCKKIFHIHYYHFIARRRRHRAANISIARDDATKSTLAQYRAPATKHVATFHGDVVSSAAFRLFSAERQPPATIISARFYVFATQEMAMIGFQPSGALSSSQRHDIGARRPQLIYHSFSLLPPPAAMPAPGKSRFEPGHAAFSRRFRPHFSGALSLSPRPAVASCCGWLPPAHACFSDHACIF